MTRASESTGGNGISWNPPLAAPPAQSASPLSTGLKQLYAFVKNYLTRMAEKMPEERYL